MSFIDAYEHLDNMCRDMNGNGISGYINDMEAACDGRFKVVNWDEDCEHLKHYRWVRNQIGRDEFSNEKNMCAPYDEVWLENFISRVKDRKDPLSLYAQNGKPAESFTERLLLKNGVKPEKETKTQERKQTPTRYTIDSDTDDEEQFAFPDDAGKAAGFVLGLIVLFCIVGYFLS